MGTKNGFSNGQIFTIIGGIISIISVFLPWFSASASTTGLTSSLSVNGLGSISGSLPFPLISEKVNWEFQGLGVLALGIIGITAVIFLRDKIQSLAMFACGVLIIGGGIVNLQSISNFSGEILGATIKSGVGYGLYIVMIGGAVAAAGGLLSWRDLRS